LLAVQMPLHPTRTRKIILNMIGQGGVATDDFAKNEEDIAADWENNDDLEDSDAEGSNKVYISCIKFISINSITLFLVYSHKLMPINGNLLLIHVGFLIDDEKVQERSYTTNRRWCDVSYHKGVRAWPALFSKKKSRTSSCLNAGQLYGTTCPSSIENGRENQVIHTWFQTQ
jgi:hypothetical protein